MEGKIFNNKCVLRLDKGEEVIESVMELLKEHNIKLGTLTGLGASNDITVGLLNTKTKEYINKEYSEEYEVTSFNGNISTKDGEIYLHMHITFADVDNNCYGGHLNRCVISGACELFIDIYDGEVDRYFNEDIGLNILKF